MPEYFLFRFLLAALLVCLCIRIWRGQHGSLLVFCVACYFEAVANAAPAVLSDPLWWRYVFLPLSEARLFLSIMASFEVFRFMNGRTLKIERHALADWATAVGLAFVWVAWYWNPVNFFQIAMTIRQYCLLALAVAVSAAWCYVIWVKPVEMAHHWRRSHGELWIAWLWLSFVMGTTGAGGLARLWGNWKTNTLWREINDSALVAQIILVAGWLWMLHRGARLSAPNQALGHERGTVK